MRVLEKCLPRNDIVRELAPYLQHVHQEDDEEHPSTSNSSDGTHDRNDFSPRHCNAASPPLDAEMIRMSSSVGNCSHPHTPREPACPFVPYDDKVPASAHCCPSPLDTNGQSTARSHVASGTGKSGYSDATPMSHEGCHQLTKANTDRTPLSATAIENSSNCPRYHSDGSIINCDVRSDMSLDSTGILMSSALQKKGSAPKIKTEIGDLTPLRWDKVVIVQVSVRNFREMMEESKDLMEDAKMLYEHTVLSRLSSEYGGQEILHQSRSGLFIIAFASEFHAAKWCLSLQLSLVYAAWSDKLLKHFEGLREKYFPPEATSKSKKRILLFRGFRVRMVIHTVESSTRMSPEKSLEKAVKWTNSASDFVHGGQIVLSESVWDRLKEQLVQLGNPVVEDLGGHMVLGEEVQLMLLLPRDLEMRRFDKLESPHQVSLGMRDAPSACKEVTMVFTFIEGARPLVRCHAEVLADRIKTLCMVARELLRKYNGYECQELQGDFMLAFFNPNSAILWCGEFQLRIRQKFREWNHDAENQDLSFSMSMGIECGIPASVSPHKTSGRADYFGNIVNQTARIAKAAHGGQILIGGDAWNTYMSAYFEPSHITSKPKRVHSSSSSVTFQFSFHGFYAFKGISSPIALIEAQPCEPTRLGEFLPSKVALTRSPKAKKVDQSDLDKKCSPPDVPTPLLRLYLDIERDKYKDTIRETELNGSFSFSSDSIVIVDGGELDEESLEMGMYPSALSGSMALAMTSFPRMNSTNMLQYFHHSPSSIPEKSTAGSSDAM